MAKKQQEQSEHPKRKKGVESPNSAFLCHSSTDSDFVVDVARYLKRNFERVYYYEDCQTAREGFWDTIDGELKACKAFIVFVSGDPTINQMREVKRAYEIHQSSRTREPGFVFCLLGLDKLPGRLTTVEFVEFADFPQVRVDKYGPVEAKMVAREVMSFLRKPFKCDGLPSDPHLFSYEKHIIEHFVEVGRVNRNKRSTENCGEHPAGEAQQENNGVAVEPDEQSDDHMKKLEEVRSRQLDGCPTRWPEVVRWKDETRYLVEEYEKMVGPKNAGTRLDNWKSIVGSLRKENDKVVVAALTNYHRQKCEDRQDGECCLTDYDMCFPEAGPREFMYFPREQKELNVAILVSGGIAPGTNAVIDGIVQRHRQYAEEFDYIEGLSIIGIRNGFLAFGRQGTRKSRIELKELKTAHMASQGGSLLGTSRDDDLLADSDKRWKKLENIVARLYASDIDILYIIGGDGSMKAAHALWTVAQEYADERDLPKLSVVAIPKTMDNDILWAWQTFGFLSAVETAREIIDRLATEVESNPRLCVVQLFGSDSGFVVSHAVLASRPKQCDVALIPEVEFTTKKLAEHLRAKMEERTQSELVRRGLVVMAETAIPRDAMDFVNEKRGGPLDIGLTEKEKLEIEKLMGEGDGIKRIQGQTNDALRSAGLKIVSQGLHKLLNDGIDVKRKHRSLRVVTNEPRHLLRALAPSCTDIIMGNRLGTLAVDNALAGYTDFMVSQWLTEYVLVPLELVVLGRKRIPETGIFWKSVVAKTGQPADLT